MNIKTTMLIALLLSLVSISGCLSMFEDEDPVRLTVYPEDPVVWHDGVMFGWGVDNNKHPKVVSWSWDFGDGGTSVQSKPIHVYRESGNFQVTLTTTHANGAQKEETIDLFVRDVGHPEVMPWFQFAPEFPCPGELIKFTDHTNSEHQIDSYLWEFWDGTTSNEMEPTRRMPDYDKDDPHLPVLNVELTVTDVMGNKEDLSKNIYGVCR